MMKNGRQTVALSLVSSGHGDCVGGWRCSNSFMPQSRCSQLCQRRRRRTSGHGDVARQHLAPKQSEGGPQDWRGRCCCVGPCAHKQLPLCAASPWRWFAPANRRPLLYSCGGQTVGEFCISNSRAIHFDLRRLEPRTNSDRYEARLAHSNSAPARSVHGTVASQTRQHPSSSQWASKGHERAMRCNNCNYLASLGLFAALAAGSGAAAATTQRRARVASCMHAKRTPVDYVWAS